MSTGIQRKVRPDGICILTLDRPGSSANIFDRATLEGFQSELDFIETALPKGLVITSAKPSIFLAGADLRFFAGPAKPEQVGRFIELGQQLMNRLASLPIPTAAAIHGAALGGGYELCLACDWRVAADAPVTKVGLPETTLGLLPAWGGVTRLPRLIGLEPALDVILGGKSYSAEEALRLGLVDEIVARDALLHRACEKVTAKRVPKTLEAASAAEVEKIANSRRQSIQRKSHGHNKAALKALEVTVNGFQQSEEESLKGERAAFAELIESDGTRNLLWLFFQEERARKPDPQAVSTIGAVAVIGAGTMGAGIAFWASSRGLRVHLADSDPAALDRARDRIAELYREAVRRGSITEEAAAKSQASMVYAKDLQTAVAEVDVVIEAVVEKLEIKRQVFGALDSLAPERTLLATNTSALSLSELGSGIRRPERLVGLHFFNPVHRMRLVEVVIGDKTRTETLRLARRFVQQLGKLPILVRDSPGFVVNRVLFPYLLEAVRLLESGASADAIDGAMLEFGMAMGPLRVIDEVGIDVALDITATLGRRLGERAEAPALLRTLAAAGRLGRKSGGGIYSHTPPEAAAVQPNELAANRQAEQFTRRDLRRRMIFMLINEAARCLEEKVAAEPADIDLAMILGASFPAFRGGPLRYADALGSRLLVQEMGKLAETMPQFAPCQMLQDLAQHETRFYPD